MRTIGNDAAVQAASFVTSIGWMVPVAEAVVENQLTLDSGVAAEIMS